MKKKLNILLASILTGAIVLSAVSCGSDQSQKFDINTLSLEYNTTVKHMDKINQSEADSIKQGLMNLIQTEMQKLNVEQNVDYTISGLNELTLNVDLSETLVIVTSVEDSSKIEGINQITINVKEDISDRKLAKPIWILNSEVDSLLALTATNVRNKIAAGAELIVSANQENLIYIDYTITNLNLIFEGATYDSFKDKIFVQSTPDSKTLTGQFQINFVTVDKPPTSF